MREIMTAEHKPSNDDGFGKELQGCSLFGDKCVTVESDEWEKQVTPGTFIISSHSREYFYARDFVPRDVMLMPNLASTSVSRRN
jgi:hypothetical protein